MSEIKVLYADGECTAEQILIDVSNQVKKHGSSDMAIVYKDDEGLYRTCATNTESPMLYFFGAILQRRALGMLESDEEE